jgi:hypothetical protein
VTLCCKAYSLTEVHEEDIEDWYFNQQESTTFQEFVCKLRALKNKGSSCLGEESQTKNVEGETGPAKEEL